MIKEVDRLSEKKHPVQGAASNCDGYDIIGDIHGHGEKLVELLLHLGYKNSATGYCHPSRKVIFLGRFYRSR